MQFQFRMRDEGAAPVTVEIGDDFADRVYLDQRAEALRVMLAEHVKWLDGEGGKRADLRGVDLSGADLSEADLRGAALSRANLTGAILPENVPAVPNIAAAILKRIDGCTGRLEMRIWHTCSTTHCVAGWAITLAGQAGAKLEDQFGPAAAGALIFAASGEPVIPSFYDGNADALADLRRRAAAKAER